MKKIIDRVSRKKGILIVFEGLSGCGKSRNAKLLLKDLRIKGYDPVMTEWNSNTVIRSLVSWLDSRDILSSNIYSLFQWFGFLLDYFRVILPALRSSRIVIADRYIYTGMTRDSVNGAGKKLGRIIGFFVRKPDCIYFIDVPSQVCLDRLKARNTVLFHTNRRIKKNRLLKNKDLYYLNKMRYAYKRLFAEPEKLKVDNILQLDFGNKNIADTKNIQGDMRMQKKEIENRICTILKNYCQYNSDHISTDCDLRENYGVDSLILVELLVDIEADFGITFDSEMLSYEHFSTVASLAEYIFEKGGEEQKVGCL